MEKEIWKQIPEYEKYEVSNFGRVRSTHSGFRRIIKNFANGNSGYLQINLSKNDPHGKRYIAELVLTVFVGERPEGREASHLNNIKTDNKLSNLAWETRTENLLRMAIKNAKELNFTKKEKINIKELYKQLKNFL